MCEKKIISNLMFLISVVIIAFAFLSHFQALAQNTNTTSSYEFKVCHVLGDGSGNVNCTGPYDFRVGGFFWLNGTHNNRTYYYGAYSNATGYMERLIVNDLKLYRNGSLVDDGKYDYRYVNMTSDSISDQNNTLDPEGEFDDPSNCVDGDFDTFGKLEINGGAGTGAAKTAYVYENYTIPAYNDSAQIEIKYEVYTDSSIGSACKAQFYFSLYNSTDWISLLSDSTITGNSGVTTVNKTVPRSYLNEYVLDDKLQIRMFMWVRDLDGTSLCDSSKTIKAIYYESRVLWRNSTVEILDYSTVGGSNNTIYVDFYKDAYVRNFDFNVSGYGQWSQTWNFNMSSPTIHHLMMTDNGNNVTSGQMSSHLCTDSEVYGVKGTDGHDYIGEAGFLWDTSTWNTTDYQWTDIETIFGTKYTGTVSISSKLIGLSSCSSVGDECGSIASFGTDCSNYNQLDSGSSNVNSYDNVTLNKTFPNQYEYLAISTKGTWSNVEAGIYSKWYNESYLQLWLQNWTYPSNVQIDVGNDGDYDYTYSEELNQTAEISPQNTGNLNSEIQDYLSTCSANATGYCSVPIVIHSDTEGEIRVSSMNINYTKRYVEEVEQLDPGIYNYTLLYESNVGTGSESLFATVYNISYNFTYYIWDGSVDDEAWVDAFNISNSDIADQNMNTTCGPGSCWDTDENCLCWNSIGYSTGEIPLLKLNSSQIPNFVDHAQLCLWSLSSTSICGNTNANQSAYYSYEDDWNSTNVTWNNIPDWMNYRLSFCEEHGRWACFNITDGIYDRDDISTIAIVGFNWWTSSVVSERLAYNSSDNPGGHPMFNASMSEYSINATSYNGTFEPTGQTQDYWNQKVCNIGAETTNISMSLQNIVNSTGDSVTSLPDCMPTYLFSTNYTFERGHDANITGNTEEVVCQDLATGSCCDIWHQIDFISCTPGDFVDFEFNVNASSYLVG
ncbi:MAG: hypothetical protein GF411_15255 [Candidatus Lokiarchaeota archaeon]|nr:hypothetical protein [Candidatus Lokiarchaeota archaeon]